jgi:tetratricopeptide (TPR) repeat protein
MAKAKAAARQAIEIDPELSDSHSALGVVLLKYDWNWPKAEEEFRRAIELNPEYAPAHYWLSGLLAVTGRADESISEAETAKMLDPFSSLSDLNLARAYYYSGRFDDALDILRSGTSESQAEVKNRYMVALILIQQKMYEDAIAILRPIFDANKLMGGAALGFAYARNGNRRAALDVLRELEMEGAISHLPPQEKAILYIGLSDNDKAFAYLDQAYKERYAPLISLKVEPLYAGLYSDPRYSELLLKMSLSPRN